MRLNYNIVHSFRQNDNMNIKEGQYAEKELMKTTV